MSTAAASRPSGHVLLSPFPNYQSASLSHVKLSARGATGTPVKSVSVSSPPSSPSAAAKIRRSCMCSPTNHPGSFRCSLHKERKPEAPAASSRPTSPPSPPSKRTASPFAQLIPSGSGCSKRSYSGLAQRVPMGSGHWARKALAPSPSAQQQQYWKRAGGYRAGASRLSAASMAGRSKQ